LILADLFHSLMLWGERLNAPPNGAHGHRKSLLDVLKDVILTGENEAHLSNTDVCVLLIAFWVWPFYTVPSEKSWSLILTYRTNVLDNR
jgi:hypothetical protein